MGSFDIDRFVRLSRAVDLSGIDWREAARVGVTDEEHSILRYMADTEAHTILYLRDLLAGHTARDEAVTRFLACWVYEETHHGLALERFLAEVGRPAPPHHYAHVTAGASPVERLEAFLALSAAELTPHFVATHMAWGALNEATAAAAYTGLARCTRNEPLAELLTRLARDERRHYSFYVHQAAERLGHPLARALCRLALQRVWGPVGIGVGGTRGVVELLFAKLFAAGRGALELERIEEEIRRLPGLARFRRLTQWRDECVAAFVCREPARWRELLVAQTRQGAP